MRPAIRAAIAGCCAVLCWWTSGPGVHGQTATTLPFDHVHLRVPDPAQTVEWYEKQFGGKRIAESPDRLMIGSTRLRCDAIADDIDRPSRTFGCSFARRRIPPGSPTVLTVIARASIPSAHGSVITAIASRTLSRFAIGSPMP